MKLGSFLESLFKKAGIDTTSEDLKGLFALDTEVSDEAAGKVGKALLTMEAAKSNPEIRKTIKAEALNGADQKIQAIIEEMGLEVDDDFSKETNTYEKIARLTRLASAAAEKKAAAKGPNKDEFAQKEIEYNRQLKELKETLKAKETEFATTREKDLTTFELKTLLSGKDYIFPKEMDAGLKISTALGAVETELNKKGFSIKRNEQGQLVILNKEGLPAHSDQNEALEPNSFIESALAQNKLLRVNAEPNPANPNPGGPIPNLGATGNLSIAAEIEAQFAELNK